jgi:uncharacterized delta-60 repeat protein
LKIRFTIVIGLLIGIIDTVYGQAGILDNTFGIGGIVTTAIGNGYVYGNAMALQTDGKILVAGSFSYNNSNFEFALLRYNTNGSLDTTFGTKGIDITEIDSFNDVAAAVAIEPNGKIVVSGYSNDSLNNKFALVRYDQSGSLDSSFGINGKVTTSFGNTSDNGNAMAIQPDGKIVVAGSASFNKDSIIFVVARYDSTAGSLDTSFGDSGKITTSVYGHDDEGYSVAIQNNGEIVVAGIAYNNESSSYDFAVVRYDSAGVPDALFGNNGKVTTDILGYGGAFANSVALQSNGQIVVAGRAFNTATNAFMFATVRYNTNGTLDNTFASGGIDTTSIGGFDDEGYSVAIQPSNEKIVVAGYAEINAVYEFAVVRYNTDGSLDTTSNGGNGKVTTVIDSVSSGDAVVIQSNGDIVVAGYSLNFLSTYYNMAVARYLPALTSGIADVAKADNSVFVYPNPVHDEAVVDYTLTSNEILSMYLYDITGKLMQTTAINENISKGTYRQYINLQELPAGVYILTITYNSLQPTYVKIIKQ